VRTRRQNRGYTFETQLVKEFNKGTWKARRLGGSSSGLPDVGIVNNTQKLMYAIEAKSTVYNFCEVPVKQIKRCIDYLDMFSVYEKRNVILAFRFATKRAILAENTLVKITRVKPVYYIFLIKKFYKISDIEAFTCNSKGSINVKINNYDSNKIYNFSEYIELECFRSINDLKNYGWNTKQSNFDHLFTK
jgi:Holliday junction resolvase